jgi:YVTN family beta-propeller protein
LAQFGVAVTPDDSKVYIANSGDDTVSVINTGTNKVIGSIAVGSDPQGVSVTSDGRKVYVANEGDGTVGGTVSIIDTATNTAESSMITVGKAPLAFGIFIPPPKPK